VTLFSFKLHFYSIFLTRVSLMNDVYGVIKSFMVRWFYELVIRNFFSLEMAFLLLNKWNR